jgi:hypothetical protein
MGLSISGDGSCLLLAVRKNGRSQLDWLPEKVQVVAPHFASDNDAMKALQWFFA